MNQFFGKSSVASLKQPALQFLNRISHPTFNQQEHHLPNQKGFKNYWIPKELEPNFSTFIRLNRTEQFSKQVNQLQKVCLSQIGQQRLNQSDQLPIDWKSETQWKQLFSKQNEHTNSSSAATSPFAVRLIWIGHVTFLIQVVHVPDNEIVWTAVTDPVFSNQIPWLVGPKRIRPIPFSISELQSLYKVNIDTVLLSHNHYDHLDYSSFKQISSHHSHTQIHTPLQHVNKWYHGFSSKQNIVEMDWYDQIDYQSSQFASLRISIFFVPAQHWSSRIGIDRNASLWGGYVLQIQHEQSKPFLLYFAGDTGYTPNTIFTQMNQFCRETLKVEGMDVSLIPIGAYEPRWFMKLQHTNPMDALEIAKETNSKQSIGTHFGTFVLTTEDVVEPKQKLQELLMQQQLNANYFSTMKHHEVREFML